MTGHGFTTGGPTVLPQSRAAVLFDGVFTTPRLQHPEGVARIIAHQVAAPSASPSANSSSTRMPAWIAASSP